MQEIFYESHLYETSDYPYIFHITDYGKKHFAPMNWHKNPEILCFVNGDGSVNIDGKEYFAKDGELIFVPPNSLHKVTGLNDGYYYCLIPDYEFCRNFGFAFDELGIKTVIRDKEIFDCLNVIAKEYKEEEKFYNQIIISKIINIISILARNYVDESYSSRLYICSSKIKMIKEVSSYIEENFHKNLSLEEIAKNAGFSKFYFCRIFKEMSGMSLSEYINCIRATKAKDILCSGKSVLETAEECGFSNFSYFTRVYKKYNGVLPSHTKREIMNYK